MKLKKATSYALHALMYMTRHMTQLPVNLETISKAEGIPLSYLSRIFQKLSSAGIVQLSKEKGKGYTFVNPPAQTNLLRLFEVMEGDSLFGNCFMNHCNCGGTTENCYIYAAWQRSTRKMDKLLTETSLVDAAWNHPEHRFNELPDGSKDT